MQRPRTNFPGQKPPNRFISCVKTSLVMTSCSCMTMDTTSLDATSPTRMASLFCFVLRGRHGMNTSLVFYGFWSSKKKRKSHGAHSHRVHWQIPEPVFVNMYGAQESIQTNRFRQAGNRFLGSLNGLQIRAEYTDGRTWYVYWFIKRYVIFQPIKMSK